MSARQNIKAVVGFKVTAGSLVSVDLSKAGMRYRISSFPTLRNDEVKWETVTTRLPLYFFNLTF